MSGIGAKIVKLDLPEDIEAQLTKVKNIITSLSIEKTTLEAEVEAKKVELSNYVDKIKDANTEYISISQTCDLKLQELKDKEDKIYQRESTLDIYANALQEKEKKIGKYLNIFEGMKDVIIKE